MAFLYEWRLSLLSGGWLVAAWTMAFVLIVFAARSQAPYRHAFAWGWLAFVMSSQAFAWWGMHGNARCFMSYTRVWLIALTASLLGSACAVATFWAVRVRSWGGPRETLLAALLSALWATLFVGSVVAYWASDSCSPRLWGFEISFVPDMTVSNMSWGLLAAGVLVSVGLGIAGYRAKAPARHALAWAWLSFVLAAEIYAWRQISLSHATDVPSIIVIGGGLGAACAAAAFGIVRARHWGGPHSTALASLLSALLLVGFFYLLYSMLTLAATIGAPDVDVP